MKDQYKRALDKIKLSDSQKEQLKDLYYADSKERKYHMKKRILRPVAVLAACLALVVAAGTVVPMLQSRWEGTSDNTAGNSTDQTKTDNYFAITAYAKELTKTGKVFPDKYASIGSAMDGDEQTKKISFAFEFPVECKGKNIDTITYAINEGAFQINNKKGQNVVIDGKKLKKKMNAPGIEKGSDDEDDEYDYETNQYKSFTVEYDKQTSKSTCIQIIDSSDIWNKEKLNQYEKKDIYHMVFESSLRDTKTRKEALDFLLKDMGITCMVTYKDGSTETKNIVVSNEVVKLSEICKTDEELPVDKNQKMVVRYFSIQ